MVRLGLLGRPAPEVSPVPAVSPVGPVVASPDLPAPQVVAFPALRQDPGASQVHLAVDSQEVGVVVPSLAVGSLVVVAVVAEAVSLVQVVMVVAGDGDEMKWRSGM